MVALAWIVMKHTSTGEIISFIDRIEEVSTSLTLPPCPVVAAVEANSPAHPVGLLINVSIKATLLRLPIAIASYKSKKRHKKSQRGVSKS